MHLSGPRFLKDILVFRLGARGQAFYALLGPIFGELAGVSVQCRLALGPKALFRRVPMAR